MVRASEGSGRSTASPEGNVTKSSQIVHVIITCLLYFQTLETSRKHFRIIVD
jgi:hypothetical protein